MGTALAQPAVDVKVVTLLGPEHPRQRLAHHCFCVLIDRRRRDRIVELVRLSPSLRDQVTGAGKRRIELLGPSRQSRTNTLASPPAGTSRRTCAATFVPSPSRLIVSAPYSTCSPIPSLAKRVVLSEPQMRAAFVSFSQNSRAASGSAYRTRRVRHAQPELPAAPLGRAQCGAVSTGSYSSSSRDGPGSPLPGRCKGTRPAGTCTATVGSCASEGCRRRSSTPSRPRRGCPRYSSSRRDVP